jgi:putative addiction module component (TIGR02574 family)
MNKIDEAWAALRKLPVREQERLAEAILDFAAGSGDTYVLTDEQAAEVERRLADPNPKYLSMPEARARLGKYLA